MNSRTKLTIEQQMCKCKNRTDDGWNLTDLHDDVFDLIGEIRCRTVYRCCARHDS